MRISTSRAVTTVVWLVMTAAAGAQPAASRIDRHAVVSRHNPVLHRLDPDSPLSVGNGGFAFTADITGLQTFNEAYEASVPLGTLSDWGWHRFPNPDRWNIDTFHFNEFDSHGRMVGYADIPGDKRTPEIQWLRANPHRLHLGRLAFDLRFRDGRAASPVDLSGIDQTLDLWTGVLTSRFAFDGQPVEVITICHPTMDAIAVRVRSPLVRQGRLAVLVAFPYGTGDVKTADWTKPDAHRTVLRKMGPLAARFERRLDEDRYRVAAAWQPGGTISQRAPHEFLVRPVTAGEVFEFSAAFHPRVAAAPPAYATTLAASRLRWRRFWSEGGAIDLSGSRDQRWQELERRVVLSQYLTAIQCAGRTPPQETGLTYNSWEGKFHLEMHWWHAAHFALWNRLPLLERSLDYYRRILPRARATAARQGYRGARWPKMTDPEGAESPSGVGPFLVWQQPHPIFYAELVYRARPDRATLKQYAPVVLETAEFMASYPGRDTDSGRPVLGPPLQCAQEVFAKADTVDCTFEVAYWRWALDVAQRWRERMKLPRDASWDAVLRTLPGPAVGNGRYLFAGNVPDSYENTRWRRDHPAVVGAFGFLPGDGVDREIMRKTFDWIWQNWTWPDTWGWDYPLMAMTAARLGDGRRAVDALLLDTPKNVYRPNGHNYQRPGLTIYLPGNGGLLYAVAMMAAGWEGGPDRPAPGFPDDGSWTVKYEGLRKAF
jgi:protein-glucosylgalactosylhydroxylysine glucosidase